MLKTYSHTSPPFRYAPVSKSLPGSPQHPQRRNSYAKEPLAENIYRPSYVEASTQWSLNSNVEMTAHADPTPAGNKLKSEAYNSSAFSIPVAVSSNSLTLLVTPSHGTKRCSSETPPRAAAEDQTLPPKCVKLDPTSVKTLPVKYESCPVEDMVILISDMIQELIQTNDHLPLRSGVLTRFHSRTPPGISILDYLQRLAKHATLTPPLLLSMVYYIDRLCMLYPAFTVNSLTVHRFLITAGTVAAKGLSDSFWNNATYARVGGIKIAELGLLELDFLYRLDWKIVPNPEALVDYYRGLVLRSAVYILEDDEESIADEDEEDEEAEEKVRDEHIKAVRENDAKWKAWMADVAAKRNEGLIEEKFR